MSTGMHNRKLEGKVAIVTGAGRGIGEAVAWKLAQEGAAVVVNDLDEQPAAAVVERITAAGGRASAYPGSVTDAGFADGIVKAALDRHGAVDIVVNNAGYTWDGLIQRMSDEQWDAIIACHLTAPFKLLRALQPYFQEASRAEAQRGEEVFRKVVNISSVSGTGGNAGQANYASAKAGIMGLTKTLAKEWGPMKVNVNCVAFGAIETRLTQRVPAGAKATIEVNGRELKVGIPADKAAGAMQQIPLGRLGTPEEAAGAVYLMCAPESDYVSGQVIICGGGRGGF